MTVSRAEPSSSFFLDGPLFFYCSLSLSPDGLVMFDARLPVVAQLGGELDHPTFSLLLLLLLWLFCLLDVYFYLQV